MPDPLTDAATFGSFFNPSLDSLKESLSFALKGSVADDPLADAVASQLTSVFSVPAIEHSIACLAENGSEELSFAEQIAASLGTSPTGAAAPTEQLSRPAWVVMESCVHYNDEYYSLEDGGEPVFVYFDQALAEAEAERRNKEWREEIKGDGEEENWNDGDGVDETTMFYVYPVKVEV